MALKSNKLFAVSAFTSIGLGTVARIEISHYEQQLNLLNSHAERSLTIGLISGILCSIAVTSSLMYAQDSLTYRLELLRRNEISN